MNFDVIMKVILTSTVTFKSYLNVSNHNGRFLADHFLDPQIYSKHFVKNKPEFDRFGVYWPCFTAFY